MNKHDEVMKQKRADEESKMSDAERKVPYILPRDDFKKKGII